MKNTRPGKNVEIEKSDAAANKEAEAQALPGPKRFLNKKIRRINAFLAVLIIISLIVLIYRFSIIPEKEDFKVELPKEGIINIHEHIHRHTDADKWLDAMEQCGVSATVMLGSPEATFLLNSPPGFNNYSKNNDVILYLEKKHDSKILAFPTIDPRDPDKLEMLKKELKEGAVGLKLYSGHTGEIFPEPKTTLYDYLGPLDRVEMDEVYEYCEKNQIPIIWHIKLKWDYLFNELQNVLTNYPSLIVDIPHFGVLGSNLTKLAELMDDYPGVYTDISFGGFAYWSMQTFSNNFEKFKSFVLEYHDRVMFGTDMVVTNNVRKTVSWITSLTMAYRYMLEKDKFHIDVPNITGEGFDFDMELNGLGLPQDILDEIYFDNPLRFLKGEPGVEKSNGSRAGVRRKIDSIVIHEDYFWVNIHTFSMMAVTVEVVYNNKLQS
jgi:predicted TIM-barrel fold metal-dependent hydrolase